MTGATLIGTWRLVATRAWDENGDPLPPPYGPAPIGMVTFTAERRMIAALCDGRPAIPAEETPGGAGEREYVSYMGAYSVTDSTLTTRVDGTNQAERLDTDQVRGVRWEGDRIVLSPPPRPLGSVIEHRELTWEKIA